MKKYTVNQGYVVLDENSSVVEWLDTLEEAEEYAEKLKLDITI